MTTGSWILLAVIFAICFTGALLFTLFRFKNISKPPKTEDTSLKTETTSPKIEEKPPKTENKTLKD